MLEDPSGKKFRASWNAECEADEMEVKLVFYQVRGGICKEKNWIYEKSIRPCECDKLEVLGEDSTFLMLQLDNGRECEKGIGGPLDER